MFLEHKINIITVTTTFTYAWKQKLIQISRPETSQLFKMSRIIKLLCIKSKKGEKKGGVSLTLSSK